jgi:hypothetical protein
LVLLVTSRERLCHRGFKFHSKFYGSYGVSYYFSPHYWAEGQTENTCASSGSGQVRDHSEFGHAVHHEELTDGRGEYIVGCLSINDQFPAQAVVGLIRPDFLR